MRDTSLEAYQSLLDSGAISRQQHQILSAIARQPAGKDFSLNELVSITGLSINVISGRCCELKKSGQLEEGPARKCTRSGKTIHPVRILVEQEKVA